PDRLIDLPLPTVPRRSRRGTGLNSSSRFLEHRPRMAEGANPMRPTEWIVLGIGVVVMLLVGKIRKPKPAPAPTGYLVPVSIARCSTLGVFAGLVKAATLFAIYTAA